MLFLTNLGWTKYVSITALVPTMALNGYRITLIGGPFLEHKLMSIDIAPV